MQLRFNRIKAVSEVVEEEVIQYATVPLWIFVGAACAVCGSSLDDPGGATNPPTDCVVIRTRSGNHIIHSACWACRVISK